MKKLTTIQLLTIIALDSLEVELTELIKSLGAKGYTVSDAKGEGLSTIRESEWEGKNIRIETLVSEEVAEKIMDILMEKYFNKYKMICFVHDVKILRREKFL